MRSAGVSPPAAVIRMDRAGVPVSCTGSFPRKHSSGVDSWIPAFSAETRICASIRQL